MADLLTPALFDRLLWAAVGAGGAALVIAVATPVSRRRRRRSATHQQAGEWYLSPDGASQARMMAQAVIRSWRDQIGSMSAMQAVIFAAEILSSDNVTGWTDGLNAVRLNVVNLARRVAAAHQPTSGGRNGAGGMQ
jgi:hypothetical protein